MKRAELRSRSLSARLGAAFLLAGIATGSGMGDPWTHQAPRPTGVDLRGVHLISPSEAWAIGDDAVLIHTTDAGQTWEVETLDSDSMWTVFFLDGQRGWAAGNGFFHTTDGGQTWIKDNDWGTISDIRFIDPLNGWACGNGGTTYRTTDGGLTWSFSTVGSIFTLRSIYFVDATTGFTVNIEGGIYESTDGGKSWSLNSATGGSNLNTIRFFDPQEGWAIGGDTFLHTTDGGQSWQPAQVPPGTWVYSAYFTDRLHGWGVGEGVNGVRTTDGGQTWLTMATGVAGPRLWDIHFVDANTGMLVAETGVVQLSTDGGSTWSALQSGGTAFTHGLDAVDSQHAWAANDAGEVLYTTDGTFWRRTKLPSISIYGRVHDVDFVDTMLGWAVGQDSTFGGDSGIVARSTDGGLSWHDQLILPPDSALVGVEVIDSLHAFTIGHRFSHGGIILRTTDGGTTWADVSPSKATYNDVEFVDVSTGWAVGGLIYKTTDGGQTWKPQLTPQHTLNSVSFGDPSHGWAVGWQGSVLRTTDGGKSWLPQNLGQGTPVVFTGVQAITPDIAWLVGSDENVRRTTDGGATWTSELLAMNSLNALEALYFLDAENGWVAGSHFAPRGGIWSRRNCSDPVIYCVASPNSTGSGAHMGHLGSLSVSANDFSLTVSGCPKSQFGLFFYGQGHVQSSLGDGVLCVGSNLVRLPVVPTDIFGQALYTLDFTGPPKQGGLITAGTTWSFQYWYRDPGFGAAGFNLSDAMDATFCD